MTPDARRFAGRQLAAALRRVRADWRAFATCVALSAVPTIIADLTLDEASALRATSVMGLLDLYLALLLTFRTLSAEGAAPADYDRRRPTEGRYPAAFLLSLFTVLGVVAGLVLLIVPGVLLFLLWSVSQPALAAERLGAVAAMKRSWALARPVLGGVGLLALFFVAAIAVLFAATILVTIFAPEYDVPLIVITDLCMSLILMFSPVVWTYAYLALRRGAA